MGISAVASVLSGVAQWLTILKFPAVPSLNASTEPKPSADAAPPATALPLAVICSPPADVSKPVKSSVVTVELFTPESNTDTVPHSVSEYAATRISSIDPVKLATILAVAPADTVR